MGRAGGAEGNPDDAPPNPEFKEGWHLGEPDLVVRMEEPYRLAAEGKDVYRNVVLPIPVAARRYVKAVELRPGNPKVVHHASMFIDQSGQSRRLARRERPAGFDGMDLPESAAVVAGQMLNWEPGKRPEPAGEGLSWVLHPNSDLVLQLHLHPSGKPEEVAAQAGFYFTDEAPTNTPYLLRLPQWQIDIPAGASNHVVQNSYVLPVDVRLLRISPHAHYLGRELQGFAILPDGRKEWLLRIKDWDFNWQGDFRYEMPVYLPRGTKLMLHFTFDNSAANPRNPNHPPKRVRQGPQTTDEMAQITFQVLPENEASRRLLLADHLKAMTLDAVAYNESLLKEDPSRADAHAKIGQALLPLGRHAEAAEHLRESIRLDPSKDKPFYDLGTLMLMQGKLPEARAAFEAVVKLNPSDFQAHGNLGAVYQREGNRFLAEFHFREALKINPRDGAAAAALQSLRPPAGSK